MRTSKTFKSGVPYTDVSDWVEGTLVELLGDSAPTLLSSIRITVEAVKADQLVIDPICETFDVQAATADVVRFVEYRRNDLRKPVSLEAVRRAIRPFAGRSRDLIASIDQSIRHGWTGLFEPKDGGGGSVSRDFAKKGGPSGGTW